MPPSIETPREGTAGSQPHALSLKVLRLSRPALATQTPLPATNFGNGLDIDTRASLAYPSAPQSSFPLAPALTLPKSFGLAYVGEKFGCTLCVNDESKAMDRAVTVSEVKVLAELQMPSNQKGLPLKLATHTASTDGVYGIDEGDTIQFNLEHELSEVGQHVLAVTVSYIEHSPDAEDRTRTFRKLYQFVAQRLVGIRSKVTERALDKSASRQWIVEAQIENLGESAVVITSLELKAAEGVRTSTVNHEGSVGISLKPTDIQQVMFLADETGEKTPKRRLGHVMVGWTGSMGEPGQVKTGWLTSKT